MQEQASPHSWLTAGCNSTSGHVQLRCSSCMTPTAQHPLQVSEAQRTPASHTCHAHLRHPQHELATPPLQPAPLTQSSTTAAPKAPDLPHHSIQTLSVGWPQQAPQPRPLQHCDAAQLPCHTRLGTLQADYLIYSAKLQHTVPQHTAPARPLRCLSLLEPQQGQLVPRGQASSCLLPAAGRHAAPSTAAPSHTSSPARQQVQPACFPRCAARCAASCHCFMDAQAAQPRCGPTPHPPPAPHSSPQAACASLLALLLACSPSCNSCSSSCCHR